jgi:hypothetical protein
LRTWQHVFVCLQGKYNALKRNHDKLELEMSQVRLWQAETMDGELEEDDVDSKSLLIQELLLGNKCFSYGNLRNKNKPSFIVMAVDESQSRWCADHMK